MATRANTVVRAVAALGAIAVASVLTFAAPGAQQPPRRVETSARAVVAALTRYVSDYQHQFASLVAEEDYVQELLDVADPATRRLRGELFLTFLEREGAWTAVRDIAEVDGVPLSDRQDLRALLRTTPMQSIARRLVDRNARYNLGTIARNFNEPTLALHLASPPRVGLVRFEVTAVDRREPEAPVVTLAFREREPPTLVRSIDGRPVYARGAFVVDAASGRVQRTTISFDNRPVQATLDTTYAPDAGVGLWVPREFHERYSVNVSRWKETVTGRAVYSNYRRFEVFGRVK